MKEVLIAFLAGLALFISIAIGVVVPGFVLSVLIPGADLIDGIMVLMVIILCSVVVTLFGAIAVLALEEW